MDSWNLRTFRNDLSIFIKLIEEKQVHGDFNELFRLLNSLENKDLIEYKLENLSFHIDGRIIGTLPEKITFYQVFLDNMLMVKDNLNQNIDPLYCYSLDINIHAYESKNNMNEEYVNCWHLDRHYNDGVTKYTHPSYHFQFGGKKINSISTGMLTVLSSPRIPHPPMDVFLGFHFIISNFFNSQQYAFVNSLLSDYNYQQIIKRAQERLWKPYFGAFIPTNINSDFTITNVFPLYIN